MATNLTNPLDAFQSYNVHYVLLGAASTQDIRPFTVDSPQAQSQSLSAIDNAKFPGDLVDLGDASSVYLLLDSRRFSQYMIDDFELVTMMSGFTVPGSTAPASTALKMKFTVTDSTGISFANFLQYIMDKKLQVSFDGMTLLLRVLFIGNNADGTSTVVQSVTIPAFFERIEVDLNEVKGLYHCTLFPMIGLQSNGKVNTKWTTIGTASSYFSGPSANKLGPMVNAFEKKLNEDSLTRYTQLNAQTDVNGVLQTVGHFGRPVQYMITLPKGWDEFAFSGPSQGGATETSFRDLVQKAETNKGQTIAQAQKKAQTSATEPAKDSYVAVAPTLSVTEVLDVIFSQCTSVAELGNFTHKQDANGAVKFYKHLITVTSDDKSFMVHVDVVEFIVPNIDLVTKSKSITTDDQNLFKSETLSDGSQRREPKQFIEFDYIFSGKNIDVLQLDLKIENLNVMLMQGTRLGSGELMAGANTGQKQADGTGIADDERPTFGLKQKDPALIPRRTTGEATNYAHLAANARAEGDATPQAVNQQYVRNLAAFYSAGPIETKMVIRGNPAIMVKVSLQSLPEHIPGVTIAANGVVGSTLDDTVKAKYRATFEQNLLQLNTTAVMTQGNNPSASARTEQSAGSPINSTFLSGRNFVSSPLFAKVNIFGPNVDFSTNTAIDGDYSQRLFSADNFYFVDQVITTIEHAKFTQSLHMRSFSIYNFPSTTAKSATASKVKAVK